MVHTFLLQVPHKNTKRSPPAPRKKRFFLCLETRTQKGKKDTTLYITNARKKEMRSDIHANHGYINEFLDSDRMANVYFTSDIDARNRIRSLTEFSKIN